VINVTISSPETSYVYYTRIPSPVYQYELLAIGSEILSTVTSIIVSD